MKNSKYWQVNIMVFEFFMYKDCADICSVTIDTAFY